MGRIRARHTLTVSCLDSHSQVPKLSWACTCRHSTNHFVGSRRRERPKVLPWSPALRARPCSAQGADYTAACLWRGCLTPASALNTSLHTESNRISLGLAPNPFMPLHAPLLPTALWGAAGCISQEGRCAGWASGVQYDPDYSSRGAISVPRLAQSHPVVKVLSQNLANKGAKPAAPASSKHCCHCRCPGSELWALCATHIPHVGPDATGGPYSSSTYTLWTNPHGVLSPARRSQAFVWGLGLPLAGGCPATRESFPPAVGHEVWLSILLLPEGASLNHNPKFNTPVSSNPHVVL